MLGDAASWALAGKVGVFNQGHLLRPYWNRAGPCPGGTSACARVTGLPVLSACGQGGGGQAEGAGRRSSEPRVESSALRGRAAGTEKPTLVCSRARLPLNGDPCVGPQIHVHSFR